MISLAVITIWLAIGLAISTLAMKLSDDGEPALDRLRDSQFRIFFSIVAVLFWPPVVIMVLFDYIRGKEDV